MTNRTKNQAFTTDNSTNDQQNGWLRVNQTDVKVGDLEVEVMTNRTKNHQPRQRD